MHVAYLMRRVAALVALVLVTSFALDAVAQVEPRPPRRGYKYRVKIDSAPQQAAIYLDDEKYGIVGYTPWTGRLQKGNWKVILKKDGYETTTRVIQIKRSRRVQETFMPMTKKIEPGVVEVRADADRNALGATVWVDGQMQGQIPVTLKIKDGRHLIEVKKDDFESFSQWVDIKEGERVTVNPMLKGAARGSLLIDADVPGAEIWIDGQKIEDTTPAMVPNLMEGPHVIEVRKEPALPWRQSVQVKKNETVKVTASLKATIGGQGGIIQVISNIDGASVLLDGTVVGKTPINIKDVKPGEHVVEVRAKGYMPRDERVNINAGQSVVLKLDLNKSAGGTVVKIVAAVPEAEVFVDGGKLGTAPQEASLAPGPHVVVVRKEGYAPFEKKITVTANQPQTVTADLKAVGGLRFVSTPAGATVKIDGEAIGATPMVSEEIAAGEHVVTIEAPGYYAYENGVKVEGGKMGVVSATLQEIDTGPTEEQLRLEQKGLTTFGAKALPAGRSTMAAGVGYPYFANARFMVGIPKLAGKFGVDSGVMFKTYGARWELSLSGRLTIVDANPFAFGTFVDAGGGSTFFDDSKRNYWHLNGGAMASLTGLGAATVTGRAYFNAFSDRHCPSLTASGTFGSRDDPPDHCVEYLAGTLDADDRARIDEVLGGEGEIFNRENGLRLMLSMAIEIAIKQHWSIWMLVEGAPRQESRGAFIDPIHKILAETDPRTYITIGGTYKF